ncbi:MAG: hypothetical protein QM796_14165 [Chthoniobacteraceae bacterium]
MTFAELHAIYNTPFFDLISRARGVYQEHWTGNEVQLCTLLSIKTGGCSEDCGYCAQSARYHTGVKAERLMETADILAVAQRAKENGSTRFCMGAAWKGVREGDAKFEQVLGTIREVSKLGMEVCVTLGQALARCGAATQGGRRHRLQSQYRYLPGVLSKDRHHPHFR